MPRGQAISIGELEFKSKQAAKKYVSGRLNSYRPSDRVTNPEDLRMLDALVDMHPDADVKRGVGIAYWKVVRNADHNQGRALGFHLYRVDGTDDDFGYVKVIDKPSHRPRVRTALMNCVRDQQQEFRSSAFANPPVYDALDGSEIGDLRDAMVVHNNPSWGLICDEVVAQFGGYDAIKLEHRDGYYGGYPTDPGVESAIRALQEQYKAGLRIVRNPAPKH